MSANLLGQLIGGAIATYLVSRFILWATRTWENAGHRVIASHAVSLLAISLLAGMGMSDGGAFAPLEAAGIYVWPQALWLAVDCFRLNSKAETNEKQGRIPSGSSENKRFVGRTPERLRLKARRARGEPAPEQSAVPASMPAINATKSASKLSLRLTWLAVFLSVVCAVISFLAASNTYPSRMPGRWVITEPSVPLLTIGGVRSLRCGSENYDLTAQMNGADLYWESEEQPDFGLTSQDDTHLHYEQLRVPKEWASTIDINRRDGTATVTHKLSERARSLIVKACDERLPFQQCFNSVQGVEGGNPFACPSHEPAFANDEERACAAYRSGSNVYAMLIFSCSVSP